MFWTWNAVCRVGRNARYAHGPGKREWLSGPIHYIQIAYSDIKSFIKQSLKLSPIVTKSSTFHIK